MRASGLDLRVLTGFPNYPGGKIYPGYRLRPIMHEVLEGVPVSRVAMFPSHDRSASRRIATYLTFALSASLSVCLGRFSPDIVHAYVGPMTLAIPAAIARACRRSRVLLDIQDLWPESVEESGMTRGRLIKRGAEALCSWAYRHADRFVVLSEGYRAALTHRGVRHEQIDVVFNWCDEAQVPGLPTPPAAEPGCNVVSILYAGNVGTMQALDVVLDAAKALYARNVAAKFVIAGSGVDLARLRSRQGAESIPNVDFIGRVEPQAMRAVYEAADAVLIHLRDGPLTRIGVPQKVQMALATGKPILFGVRGESRRLIEGAGAGLFFEPGSVQGLVGVVEGLAAMPRAERRAIGVRGRRFYFEGMSFAKGSQAMLSVYASMCQSGSVNGAQHRGIVPGLQR